MKGRVRVYQRTRTFLLAAMAVFGIARGVAGQPRREIVVTFDDLPVVTYAFRNIDTAHRITSALVASIRSHRVPAIGFVNERALATAGSIDDRRVALLRQWIDAGLELGNHTYSHLDLHRTFLPTYLEDIRRGDSVTAVLLRAVNRKPRYFRHPFLHSGRDLGTRRGVERFLHNRGYRIAPVTIDNSDYVFAVAYERAVARSDGDERWRIAAAYVDYMERVVAYYELQSLALLGREIPQVLLLHANMLNADHFGALATMLERRGYSFVSLEQALRDAAYESEDTYMGSGGISWLHRWALTRGKQGVFFAGEPAVPEDVAKAAAIVPNSPRL